MHWKIVRFQGMFVLVLDGEPIAFSNDALTLLTPYGMHTGQPELAIAS